MTSVRPWVLYREPAPCIPVLRKERDRTHCLVCTAVCQIIVFSVGTAEIQSEAGETRYNV